MRKNIWLWGGYITLAILFTFVLSHLIYHGYHHTLNSFKALFQATSAPPAATMIAGLPARPDAKEAAEVFAALLLMIEVAFRRSDSVEYTV